MCRVNTRVTRTESATDLAYIAEDMHRRCKAVNLKTRDKSKNTRLGKSKSENRLEMLHFGGLPRRLGSPRFVGM